MDLARLVLFSECPATDENKANKETCYERI